MSNSTPQISITSRDGRVAVRQQRPNVTGILGGLSLEEAILRIPLLLPICGHAQGIAAQRAAFAARGKTDPYAREHTSQLWREQGIAAAWRLAIDWPGCLNQQREIALFKAVQNADGPETLATHLLHFLPGLITVEDLEELERWIEDSPSTAASTVRRAMQLDSGLEATGVPDMGEGETLKAMAQTALSRPRFDPLAPDGAGIEVGPMAMHRHPLIGALNTSSRYGALSRRLVAQLLDTLAIAGHLLDEQSTYPSSAWTLSRGVGLGRAVTARGPVFHRVELDENQHVHCWRVLAPTDWHFAPGGALEVEANRQPLDLAQLRLLVLGFDPCAPWRVETEQAAHA